MSSEEIKNKFEGKWKVYKSENLEDFLKELGMNLVKRKAAANLSPTHTISVNGDNIKIIIDAGMKKRDEEFTLNVEQERTTENDQNVKSVMTYADGKLTVVNTPIDKDTPPMSVVRERNGDELVMIMSRGSVVAKRIFKRA